jgi:hypothetical protein
MPDDVALLCRIDPRTGLELLQRIRAPTHLSHLASAVADLVCEGSPLPRCVSRKSRILLANIDLLIPRVAPIRWDESTTGRWVSVLPEPDRKCVRAIATVTSAALGMIGALPRLAVGLQAGPGQRAGQEV